MQTKLTLRLDDQLVKDAKQHARQTGKSLSQMVTEYFSAVTSPEAAPSELTPTVSKLKGVLAETKVDVDDYLPARTVEHRGTGRALNVRGHLDDDAVG